MGFSTDKTIGCLISFVLLAKKRAIQAYSSKSSRQKAYHAGIKVTSKPSNSPHSPLHSNQLQTYRTGGWGSSTTRGIQKGPPDDRLGSPMGAMMAGAEVALLTKFS